MLRECKKLKIALFSMSSSDAMYEYLLGVGMNIVDENRFFESRIAEMAIQFSRETVSYVEFFILGGDAKTVADIGVQLLAVCRNVYADGAAFEAASELVLETAGVPLRRRSSSPCVEIEIYPERIMFRYGEKTAVPSDFDVIGVPPEIEKYFGENNLALVSLLEICGVFGKNEIKTAYLAK